MADKETKGDGSTRDLTVLPDLTFGFVESTIRKSSQSLDLKEMSKGYKYFSEKYVTNISIINLKIRRCGLIPNETTLCQRPNDIEQHDDNVNVYPCGIIVSPYSPWLAASPDRKVCHPSTVTQFGLLEIKCPVKPLSECMYLTGSVEDRNLKQNYNYFYQVIMQLAVTGLKWCYFFIWRTDEYHEDIIDEEVWNKMKHKLDLFYFYHFIE